MPSICALLTNFFEEMKIKFDSELATRLLLGVCTDCGFFQYGNSPESIKYATKLISYGADYYNDIAVPVLASPLRLKKYFSYLLTNIKIDEKRKVGYVSMNFDKVKEFGLNRAEVRLGINEMQNLEGVDFVFNLIELEDHIKGSFRTSASKKIDISMFAKELGGGGHKPAAAFTLPKMPLKEAERKVLEAIDKVGVHYF
jgi:phosphoesterase RecJ-like protein